MQPDRLIDLSGLNCPLPILRSKKALAEMDSGTVLEVIATDPGAPKDFEAFCRQTGNALLASETTAEGKFRMVIRRK
ncbi:SirA family protein [Pseudogulbenkiania sp. NH8B]|jgi:tRNA 2-thiouridine synthesizing protein A|uniref:tRNA 2-thiouridine synthesizing protein A n=2 Tax=Pseudogulbenkiania TaxID=568394 RepID=A0A1Y6BA92_9NEIS|nr:MULTISPECIES: sulfurtransferase TusA family protein [Pseudogulbenkiania]EEG07908.1 SirA family protein [Pseudogulbenkiania ferrooxidans 2002]BAK75034.1 SirA family protein [Pseudogulbenkiania sp. NH8B]SME93155.1 tRNA 2-thiouridine synthesizing protein A [Pseudogulbenkiania subflava DSM 22618]